MDWTNEIAGSARGHAGLANLVRSVADLALGQAELVGLMGAMHKRVGRLEAGAGGELVARVAGLEARLLPIERTLSGAWSDGLHWSDGTGWVDGAAAA